MLSANVNGTFIRFKQNFWSNGSTYHQDITFFWDDVEDGVKNWKDIEPHIIFDYWLPVTTSTRA